MSEEVLKLSQPIRTMRAATLSSTLRRGATLVGILAIAGHHSLLGATDTGPRGFGLVAPAIASTATPTRPRA